MLYKITPFLSITKTQPIFLTYSSQIAQLVKNPPVMGRPQFNSWVRKIPWKRDRLPTPVFWGFPGGSIGKESACRAGDLSLIPWSGRSPGEGSSYPLQFSGLENSMDRRAWQSTVHGITKSRTQLNDIHCPQRCLHTKPQKL